MKTKFISSLIVIIAAIVFQARIASACDCDMPTVKQAVASSSAIFTGRVIKVDNEKSETKFEIYRTWKGVKTKTVSVFFNADDCSFHFQNGLEYLVYASGKNQLSTSVCQRTNYLENTKKDLVELGKGTKLIADEIFEIRVQNNYGNTFESWENPIILRSDDKDNYAPQLFQRLAQWLQSKNFFSLKDNYIGPNVGSDGGFTQITVVRGETHKVVTAYGGENEKELWEIEMVIRGVAADIAAQKEREKKSEELTKALAQ